MIAKQSSKSDNALGWWTLKLAVFCLATNYVLGGWPVLFFAFGCWWGMRDESADGE
jgi:hypothetical protein